MGSPGGRSSESEQGRYAITLGADRLSLASIPARLREIPMRSESAAWVSSPRAPVGG